MAEKQRRTSAEERPEFLQSVLTDREFKKFADYIYGKCGIKLSPVKKTMLSARLNRRLRRLQIPSFTDYFDYVTSPEGEKMELVYMLDEVSTNKTDFFREPEHFEFMTQIFLPEYAKKARYQARRKLRIWSAGCSSGEEPYTIAMILADYERLNPWFSFSLLATDISTKVLAIAEKGIYTDDRLIPVSSHFRQRYMMRGKSDRRGLHKIVPELRNKITFKRLNFLESSFDFSKDPFDIIFCRNVIIYFDRETQIELFKKFYKNLHSDGYIFIGHSETLPGLENKVKRVAPAIYKSIG